VSLDETHDAFFVELDTTVFDQCKKVELSGPYPPIMDGESDHTPQGIAMANLQTGSLLGYLQGIATRATFEQSTDRELLRRFSNDGDEAAFAALVHRHGAMVLHAAQRVLDRKQDAEDVFQAVFLVLASKATGIAWRDSIAGWLYQATNRLAQEAKSTDRRRQIVEARAAARPPVIDPLAEISLRETLLIFEAELSKLSGSLRMPIVLCLLEGEGQENSARRLGCSLATLKRRLARGRQVLQARLARRGLPLAAVMAAVEVSRETSGAATSALLVGSALRAALALRRGHALAGQSVVLAQSMLRSFLFAKVALAGCLATVCCVSLGMGIAWQQGHGTKDTATKDTESLPIRATPQANAPANHSDALPAGAVARLGTLELREGFPGLIRLAPDGKTFLSLDTNRTLRRFDTASGKILEQRQLPVLKQSRGFQAAFSRNLDRLVARTDDGFEVWDLARHERLRTLRMDPPSAFRTALSPDDRTFAALEYAGGNGVLRLWDIETGETRIVGDHVGIITGVAFSPDGARVVTVDPKGSHCWQVNTGKAIWHNKDRLEDRPVFLPDGHSFLGIWHFPTLTMRRWDALTGKQIESDKLPKIESNSSLMISPDGRTLALLNQDKGLQFWNLQTGTAGARIMNATNCCSFSPDGKTVMGATGTTLARWEVSSGKALYPDTEQQGHTGPVHALAFAQNGSRLISSSMTDETVRTWDLASRKPVLQIKAAKIRYDVLAVSSDAKQIAGALEGLREYGLIRMFDATTGQATQLLSARNPLIANERVALSALRFSSDGKQLQAFGAVDDETMGPTQSVIAAIDVASGRQLYRRTSTAREAAKCVTSDGKLYLSNDGRAFDTESGKQILDIKTTFSQAFDSCVFSPDQSLLAGTISEHYQEERRGGIRMKGFKVWEMASGKVVAEFDAAGWFGHLVFTPDARYLVGTDASRIRVFDILQNRECLQFANSRHVHDADHLDFFAGALCISPDGRTLASGHADTTILLWNLPRGPQPASKTLNAAQLKDAWTTLTGNDARRARVAMNDMMLSPAQAVAFLSDQLKPVRDSRAERIKGLIAALDAKEFEKREDAHRALVKLNGLAEPDIRRTLEQSPSAEARRRLNQILLSSPDQIAPGDLQVLRAVQVLEQIGTPEARQLLRTLAEGVPAAVLTRRAREALDRIGK
jgi:RNA polymerase sigma factor (sigma-70 family)